MDDLIYLASEKTYQKPATGNRTKYWKGVTEQVRKKNNGVCVICGEPATTNDHIVPWKFWKMGSQSRGEEIDRFNDINNMQPMCRSCNSRKGANIPE